MNPVPPPNVDPPLWVAWHQAIASIRVRFLRMLITALGIALGIAFFAYVQAYAAIAGASSATDQASADRLEWLAITSLAMCLVGVTNSMLMSVTERYREIGTIKCLGASDGFIVKVFFLEAVLLGLLGSSMGSLAGAGLVALVTRGLGFEPFLLVLAKSIALGLVLTVLSAIAPAIQAARMPAAAALRVEV